MRAVSMLPAAFCVFWSAAAGAADVTLAAPGLALPAAGPCAAAQTFTFDHDRVVVHDAACAVAGRAIARGIDHGRLRIVRDHRPVLRRAGYKTLHRSHGILLAAVDDPAALAATRHVYVSPAQPGRVVTPLGTPATAAAPDPAIAAFLATLDVAAYTEYLTALAPDDTTRCMCSRSSVRAQNRIATHFEEMGLETTVPSYKSPCYVCDELDGKNVVAVKRGTTRPEEYYLFGAHYDSMSLDACVKAPGANDNASGVAALMELARALKETTTGASVMLVAFGGEEWGLLGSNKLAQDFAAGEMKDKVKGFLAIDMISFHKDQYGVLLQGTDATAPQRAVIDLVGELALTYTGLAVSATFTYAQDSDHAPFLGLGIPGMLIIESDYDLYEHYHTVGDLLVHQDMAYGLEATKLAAATLATWAGVTLPAPDAGAQDVGGTGKTGAGDTGASEADAAAASGGDGGAGGCGCAVLGI